MTRSPDDAPLHERLEAMAAELAELYWPKDAADLREAAAALRPPEGDLGALRSRLRQWAEGCGGQSAADLRAALAHLRRLGQVEAALKRLGSMEAFVTAGLLDPERDAELAARIDFARRALAPAPAAEPNP